MGRSMRFPIFCFSDALYLQIFSSYPYSGSPLEYLSVFYAVQVQ